LSNSNKKLFWKVLRSKKEKEGNGRDNEKGKLTVEKRKR
jgi:hypothetical protein